MVVEKKEKENKNKKLERIKGFFTTDIGAKLIVLLISVFLWIFTVLNNEYSYTFEVYLDVINIKPGKILKEPLPERIKAKFTGRGLDLVYLLFAPASQFRFVLDLQKINWYYEFPLASYYESNPEKIVYPRKSNIVFNQIVWPDTVVVKLDRFEKRKLPVVPHLEIEVASGYMKTGDLEIYPDSVIITGPWTYISKLKAVETEFRKLEKVTGDVEEKLEIIKPPGYNVTLFDRYVICRQKIDLIGERVFEEIPVEIRNVPRGFEVYIDPPSVNLKLVSPLGLLKKVDETQVQVYWDFYRQYVKGKKSYVPRVELPEGIVSYELVPQEVEIRVVRKSVKP